MPYTVINKLNRLMEEDFPSQRNTHNPYLGKVPTELPEHVLAQIDDIVETAQNVFGVRKEPSVTQLRVMSENGYNVKFTGEAPNCWKKPVIETPRGLIAFW